MAQLLTSLPRVAHKKVGRTLFIQLLDPNRSPHNKPSIMASAYSCALSLAPASFITNLGLAGVENCPVSWTIGADAANMAGRDSYFQGEVPLPQWVGWVVVIGFGALFSIFTTIVVYLDKTFAGNASMTSEHFK